MEQQELVFSEKINKDEGIHQDELKPQLRFPEFTDDWKESNLGNLFNFSVAGDMDKELFSEIKDGEFKYPLYANALEKEGLLGYYKESKYVADSITITARGNIGHSIVRKSDFNAIGRLIILNSKKELNNDFFSEYINSNLKIYIESTGVPQLTAPSLKINKVKYPSLDEQNKIANFILAINKKIELLENKQNALENYFFSLRTRLFQQNLRFEKNFGEWEQKKLKDIGEIITGNTPSTKHSEYYGDEYNWITPSDITDSRFVKESERKLSEEGFKKSRFVPENSILVTCIASIGKNCLTTEVCAFNQQINGIIPSEENDANFIYYLMGHYSEKLVKYAGITATPILNKKSFSNMEFEFPNLQEQRKISNCLTTIDDMKELNLRKISIMNKFKNGLLQKMFV